MNSYIGGYRNNRWYEVCEMCDPEWELTAPLTKRICPEHLAEIKSFHTTSDGVA